MENVSKENYKAMKEKYELIHAWIVFFRVFCILGIVIPLMLAGAAESVSENGGKIIWAIIVIMGVALVVLGIVGSTVSSVLQECQEMDNLSKVERLREENQYLEDAFKKLGIIDKCYCGDDNICVGENRIYILGKADMDAISRYSNETDNNLLWEQAKNKVELHSIENKDIIYFAKEGDVQYTTLISGGGGGGSSVGGAIIGGIIAGETGAIIGSRKKQEEIKTVENKHDTRETVIRYKIEEKIIEKRFNGFKVYSFLFKYIPEKDIMSMQLDQSKKGENDNSDNIEERLIKLKNLYEKELIDTEEYEKKRNEIIDSI